MATWWEELTHLKRTLMLGKIEGRRRRGRHRMRWLDGITESMDMGLGDSGSWWWTGRPGVLQFMGSQSVRHGWATELNWNCLYMCIHITLPSFFQFSVYTSIHSNILGTKQVFVTMSIAALILVAKRRKQPIHRLIDKYGIYTQWNIIQP